VSFCKFKLLLVFLYFLMKNISAISLFLLFLSLCRIIGSSHLKSGRCVNFSSSHPKHFKYNTIVNLVDQAILLSDESFHDSNLEIVKNILINNGHPLNVIDRRIKERLWTIKKNGITASEKTKEKNTNINKVLVVP